MPIVDIFIDTPFTSMFFYVNRLHKKYFCFDNALWATDFLHRILLYTNIFYFFK